MTVFYNAYGFESTITLTVKNAWRGVSLPVVVWIILFSYLTGCVYISNIMMKILVADIILLLCA